MPTVKYIGSVPPSEVPAAVEKAIRDFHTALDRRKNGDTAAHDAIDTIEEALGLRWEQQS